MQLVSDLIDGTFHATLQPKLEAQMKAQQQAHAMPQQQTQVAQEQQALQAQQVMLLQMQALVGEVTKLRTELSAERAAKEALRQEVVDLKKKMKRAERDEEERREKIERERKKTEEDLKIRAQNANMLAKMKQF